MTDLGLQVVRLRLLLPLHLQVRAAEQALPREPLAGVARDAHPDPRLSFDGIDRARNSLRCIERLNCAVSNL